MFVWTSVTALADKTEEIYVYFLNQQKTWLLFVLHSLWIFIYILAVWFSRLTIFVKDIRRFSVTTCKMHFAFIFTVISTVFAVKAQLTFHLMQKYSLKALKVKNTKNGVHVTTRLANNIYNSWKIPEELTKCTFITLQKKNNANEC